MSKRPLKPLGIGGCAKIPKLDVTISEHSFPLSQNVQQRSSARESALADVWGDENDDDLLLQASQACEQNDLSALPNYNDWVQAPSTSTQTHTLTPNAHSSGNTNSHSGYQKNDLSNQNQSITNMATPSTWKATINQFTSNHSKKTPYNQQSYQALSSSVNDTMQKGDNESNFQFKKPTLTPTNGVTSLAMKDKCNRISTPLPGIVGGNARGDVSDELFVLDDKRTDSEHFYKRLLQVQKENAKLKSENGKLLEQALSKDGEVTILRGRLKSSQAAVDNARLDRMRASESAEREWAEKLSIASKELSGLRTQLDCKEIEIARVKERCKMLESNRIKMSQVTPTQQSRTRVSQQNNNTFNIQNEMSGTFLAPAVKRKVSSASVQTQNANNFLILNAAYRSTTTELSHILLLLLEPEAEHHFRFQDFGGKLQMGSDFAQTKCRIFENAQAGRTVVVKKPLSLSGLCKDVSYLTKVTNWDCIEEGDFQKCLNIMTQVKTFLTDVLQELESVSQKVTTAFLRELDDKYVQQLAQCAPVERDQLYAGKAIFKEEHKIGARRGTAALATLCSLCGPLRRRVCCAGADGGFVSLLSNITCHLARAAPSNAKGVAHFVTSLRRDDGIFIVSHCCYDSPLPDAFRRRQLQFAYDTYCSIFFSCAVQYSGLLLSFVYLIQCLLLNTTSDSEYKKLSSLVKDIVLARPSLPVIRMVLPVLRTLSLKSSGLERFCTHSPTGNLKMDYDQGLVMFKRESCFLQVFLGQLETCVRCSERQQQTSSAVSVAQSLLSLYRNADTHRAQWCQLNLESKCKCPRRLAQVIVYTLQVCVRMLKNIVDRPKDTSMREELLVVCRGGITLLYQWSLRDVELRTLLDPHMGRCHLFVDLCDEMKKHIVVDEIQGNVLSELVASLQPNPEDLEASPVRYVWTESFSRFNITD